MSRSHLSILGCSTSVGRVILAVVKSILMKLKCKWRSLPVFLSFLLLGPSLAQAIEPEMQSWHLFFTQGKLSPNCSIYLEAQPRFRWLNDRSSFSPGTTERFLLRPAIIRKLSDGVSTLALGYGWTPLLSPNFQTENRLWQQFQTEFRPHETESKMIFRTRLEQRRIESTHQTAHRLRQMVRWLSGISVGPEDWGLGKLAISDEVFFNLNTVPRGPQGGFDQNRIFLGSHFKVSDSVWWEAGYLNAWVARPSREDRMIHALYTFAAWNW